MASPGLSRWPKRPRSECKHFTEWAMTSSTRKTYARLVPYQYDVLRRTTYKCALFKKLLAWDTDAIGRQAVRCTKGKDICYDVHLYSPSFDQGSLQYSEFVRKSSHSREQSRFPSRGLMRAQSAKHGVERIRG